MDERNYLAEFEYANKHEVEKRQSAHARAMELFGYKINSCSIIMQDKKTGKIHDLPAMWGGIEKLDDHYMYVIRFCVYVDDNVIPTDNQDSADWCDVIESGFIYFEGETAEESLYNLIQALNEKPHQLAAHVCGCSKELYEQFVDINLLAVKFAQY